MSVSDVARDGLREVCAYVRYVTLTFRARARESPMQKTETKYVLRRHFSSPTSNVLRWPWRQNLRARPSSSKEPIFAKVGRVSGDHPQHTKTKLVVLNLKYSTQVVDLASTHFPSDDFLVARRPKAR